MPRLSDSMEEGTVLAWRKQVGDEVAVGEEIVEIETDKANMGYEADVAGTLLEIVVGENEGPGRRGDRGSGTPMPRVRRGTGPQAAGPVTAGDHHPLRWLKLPQGRSPLPCHPRRRRSPPTATGRGGSRPRRWRGASPRSWASTSRL